MLYHRFGNDDPEVRKDELIRKIEHAIERLSLVEIEALYYDMITKGYLDESY